MHAVVSACTSAPPLRGARATPLLVHVRAHVGALSRSTPALFPVLATRAPSAPTCMHAHAQ
jgi:hypothetical protein